MGVVVRKYIDILTIIINFPYSTCISSFLAAASLLPCSMFFRSFNVNIIILHIIYFRYLYFISYIYKLWVCGLQHYVQCIGLFEYYLCGLVPSLQYIRTYVQANNNSINIIFINILLLTKSDNCNSITIIVSNDNNNNNWDNI